MGFDAAAPSLLAIGRTRQIDLIDFSPPFTSWKALHVPRFVLQGMGLFKSVLKSENPHCNAVPHPSIVAMTCIIIRSEG
jgi:hypothetical protein